MQKLIQNVDKYLHMLVTMVLSAGMLNVWMERLDGMFVCFLSLEWSQYIEQ